uniref:SET domain-containing protein n=1 Tax=Parastrongyloides trichosuri TaxID=131310 RepID=A0A0N4ZD29_PARTI
MDPLWNGEPSYYHDHTSTSSSTYYLVPSPMEMGNGEVSEGNFHHHGNNHQQDNTTFSFPRYETVECSYAEQGIGGYHPISTTIENQNDLDENFLYTQEDDNALQRAPVYYNSSNRNNEQNLPYINSSNNQYMYNNIVVNDLYEETSQTPNTLSSTVDYTSLEDEEEGIVSEGQLQDEMEHFEDMLNKFSSNDSDNNIIVDDFNCDDMLTCFDEHSIDDNFLKLFDSIESSPDMGLKNDNLSPLMNDIFMEEDVCIGDTKNDTIVEEDVNNKVEEIKNNNKCITCSKDIVKNVFKLSKDKFKSIIYCSASCIKKRLEEWLGESKMREKIELKLLDDENVKKEMNFCDAYKFLRKSPFYIPVDVDKDENSDNNGRKETMMRNGFKKLTFNIFLLLLKKSEIEAGKDRMVKAFVNELERQIYEKFMGNDFCDYKKFARYFMHNQEKRRMPISELLVMPLKEVKNGIKNNKHNGTPNNLLLTNKCKIQKKSATNNIPVKNVNNSSKINEIHEGDTFSLVDTILGDTNDDTTSKHLNHLYDSNCKICQDKKIKEERAIREREEMVAEREAKRKKREMEIENRMREEKMNLMKREMEEKKKMENNACNVTLYNGKVDIPITLYSVKNPDIFCLEKELPKRLEKVCTVKNINTLKDVFELSIDSLQRRVMVCMVEATSVLENENFNKYRKYLFRERLGIMINLEKTRTLKSLALLPLDSFADIPELLFDLPGYEISLFDFSNKFVGVFLLNERKLMDIILSPPKPPILSNTLQEERIIKDDKSNHIEDNVTSTINENSNCDTIKLRTPKISNETSKDQHSTSHSNVEYGGFQIKGDKQSGRTSTISSSNEAVSPVCSQNLKDETIDKNFVPHHQTPTEESRKRKGGGKSERRRNRRNKKNKKAMNRNDVTKFNMNNMNNLNNTPRNDFRPPSASYYDDLRMSEERFNRISHMSFNNGSPMIHQLPSPSGIYSHSPRSLQSGPRFSYPSSHNSYPSRGPVPLMSQDPSSYLQSQSMLEHCNMIRPRFSSNQHIPLLSTSFPRLSQGPPQCLPMQQHPYNIQDQRNQHQGYYPPNNNKKFVQSQQQSYYNNLNRSRHF